MNNRTKYFFMLISIIFLNNLTTTAVASWVETLDIKVAQQTNTAGFLDSDYGITVGNNGAIYRTIDGGQGWAAAENYSWCLFGLDIVDESIAWSCGNACNVRVSTDGGYSWNEVTNYGAYEPNQCRFISFLDDRIGWIASPIQLGSTTDGGNSWIDIKLPDSIKTIVGMTLLKTGQGYFLDSDCNLYITKDGGNHWLNRDLGSFKKNGIKLPSGWAPSTAMRFSDSDHGLVVVIYTNKTTAKNEVWALRTADCGQTWSEELIVETSGALHLSHDEKILTIYTPGRIRVFTDEVTAVSDKSNHSSPPKNFLLEQNYPNPFNPSTTISYSIPKKSFVSLEIFDVLGKGIQSLVHESQEAGEYHIQFKGDHLSSGIYFYELYAGSFRDVKKLMLIK